MGRPIRLRPQAPRVLVCAAIRGQTVDAPFESLLASTLVQALQTDRSLSRSEAVEQVLRSLPALVGAGTNEQSAKAFLAGTAATVSRLAVLNPEWGRAALNIRFHYFLVNAQAGTLPALLAQVKRSTGLSHYILYGRWDSLIVLQGTDDQAAALLGDMQQMNYVELEQFASRSVPYFYRTPTETAQSPATPAVIAAVNAAIDDYDQVAARDEQGDLEAAGILLPPTWRLDPPPESEVDAVIGITVRGGGLSAQQLLAALLRDDVVSRSLVHLVEVDRGIPFHYLAFVTCRDLGELDHLTDFVAFLTLGRASLETATHIVATGRTASPRIDAGPPSFAPIPDFGHVEEVGKAALLDLGPELIAAFNNLDGAVQLAVLRGFAVLRAEVANRNWDEERNNRILEAQRLFVSATLAGATLESMEAPALAIANTVERAFKHSLRVLATAIYGTDLARAQSELHLPTRDFRRISIGKGLPALRAVKAHPSFVAVAGLLEEDWLARIGDFGGGRNAWAHAEGPRATTHTGVIDEVLRFLVEGISLIRWLAGIDVIAETIGVDLSVASASETAATGVAAPAPMVRLSSSPKARGFGVFLSYSSLDGETAAKIARGIKSSNVPMFFAGWSIAPSESIIDRINDALAVNDTIVVLLSPNSIASRWVHRELNAALMQQLRGQDIAIVPVLIEDCTIPETLVEIKYIDMRGGRFYDGFLELIDYLKARSPNQT
jgi:hypothetical protein